MSEAHLRCADASEKVESLDRQSAWGDIWEEQYRARQRSTTPQEVSPAANTFPPLALLEAGKTSSQTIEIDGEQRRFLIHLPKDYDGNTRVPVVLAFHGYGMRRGQGDTERGAVGFEEVSGLSAKADRERFIVVYPEGNPSMEYSWNNRQWWFSKLDDVKFVKAILQNIKSELQVDPSRVYLLGYSNGGSFAHRLANEMPGEFAAMAEYGGWMTGKEERGKSKVPILAIQTIPDSVAPHDGRTFGLTMKPEQYTTDFYRESNGITGQPTTHHETASDGTKITHQVSVNQHNGSEVRTMYIDNPTHLWLGGKTMEHTSINLTEEVWSFLRRFQRPDPSK